MWGVRTWSMHVSMSMQFLPPQSQNAGALPALHTGKLKQAPCTHYLSQTTYETNVQNY